MKSLKFLHFAILILLVFTACKRKTTSPATLQAADRALLARYSELLGEPASVKYLAEFKFIDAWWGTPYRLGGTDQQGVDCSGFVQQYYLTFKNKQIPRNTMGQYQQASKRKITALEFGDLVFFDLTRSGKIGHVGIYLQNGRFVHASTSKGVRIDYLEDVYYSKQRKYGAYFP
jgi:hypothetical protein